MDTAMEVDIGNSTTTASIFLTDCTVDLFTTNVQGLVKLEIGKQEPSSSTNFYHIYILGVSGARAPTLSKGFLKKKYEETVTSVMHSL